MEDDLDTRNKKIVNVRDTTNQDGDATNYSTEKTYRQGQRPS